MNLRDVNLKFGKLLLGLLFIVVTSFVIQKKKLTVWMIGDSTMAIKEAKVFPETGWGMEFVKQFNSSISVENKAMNGRSTKSFINEGRWKQVIDNIHQGDYLLIEFGHNDEKVDKPAVGTSITEFKANLTRFVLESRAKGGIPVLLTPITRRTFKGGILTDTHGNYPDAISFIANSLKVPFIDMLAKSKKVVSELGDEASKKLYNYVEPSNVNYPQGKRDDTHFSPDGAKKMAELAVVGIKELKLELAKRLLNN